MSCPDYRKLERYAFGGVTGTDNAAIEEHLRSCKGCRDLLSDISDSIGAEKAAGNEADRRRFLQDWWLYLRRN